MSIQVTCKCQVADIHQTVLDRALSELKGQHSMAIFSLQNGVIKASFDSDYYSKGQVQQSINSILQKHKKQFHEEENKRKKIAILKALQKSGFNVKMQRRGSKKVMISGTR
ncbi:MAG: hypothetical protein U9P90_02430 [Patescibacteria group bacterium]|nr:hypothetical protein [Patescibacteria group bacterium]